MPGIRDFFERNFSDPQVNLLAILLLSGLAVIVFLGDLLAPVLGGLVIAYLLDSPTQWLVRRGAFAPGRAGGGGWRGVSQVECEQTLCEREQVFNTIIPAFGSPKTC